MSENNDSKSLERWVPFFSHRYPNGQGGVTPFQIIHAVALVFDLQESQLFSATAAEPIATARALAMTLVANCYDLETDEVAMLFGCQASTISKAKARVAALYASNRWDAERFAAVCTQLRLPLASLSLARPIQGHRPLRGKQTVRVDLANLDPLDAELVRTMIRVLTDPGLSENRAQLRSGAIALTSDGTEPTWVTPAS